MTNDSNLLFVYGTLLMSENEFGIYLSKNATLLTRGRFRGTLYDLGCYPAAVFQEDAETFVLGWVMEADDIAEVLGVLDVYEGLDDNLPEYRRELIDVETSGETKRCWVYLYNRSEANLKPIPEGDYLMYKKSS